MFIPNSTDDDDDEHQLTQFEFSDKDPYNSLLDEPLEGGSSGRSSFKDKKGDLQSLLDEPLELEEKGPRQKKPDIKSMLEAAKRAKEIAMRGAKPDKVENEELDIPSDIPRHHFELEDSQAFFDMDSSRSKQQKQQKQQQQQQPLQQQHSQPQQPSAHQPIRGPAIQQQPPQQQQQPPMPSQAPHPGQHAHPFMGGLPPHSRVWLYRDPKGNEQGPFASSQMEKWLNAQYFTIDLEMRSQEDPQFVPLVIHFLREGRNPFSGVPLQQWFAVPVLSDFQQAVLQVRFVRIRANFVVCSS